MTDYIRLFQNLNVNKNGGSSAPHKPILLLSIMDLIEAGKIESSFIPLSDLLISQFNRNWHQHISRSSKFNCGLQYPFYHLSTSPFWHLVKTENSKAMAPGSLKSLRRDFRGAFIDKALFELMKEQNSREALRNVLITTYLSDHQTIAAEPLLSALAVVSMFEFLLLNA